MENKIDVYAKAARRNQKNIMCFIDGLIVSNSTKEDLLYKIREYAYDTYHTWVPGLQNLAKNIADSSIDSYEDENEFVIDLPVSLKTLRLNQKEATELIQKLQSFVDKK